MIQVFSKDWFALHQKKLLWFANTFVGRYVLRIHGKRSSVGKHKIKAIIPNAIAWELEDGQIQAEFRTRNKFARRLYLAFKPIWYFMHFLDWLVLDRFEMAQKYSFGFATLTAYPDPDVETVSVDGYVLNIQLLAVGWASVRSAATGTDFADNGTSSFLSRCLNNDTEYSIRRTFFLFDTSSLTAAANVSAAVLSIYVTAVSASSAYNTRLVTTTPASNTALAIEDYDQVGSTAQATDVASGSVTTSAYNDWTLNATGLSNVSKTSITKFGFRDVEHDIDGTAPTSLQDFRITGRMADFADVTSDPKLVVTYNFGSGSGNITLLGV